MCVCGICIPYVTAWRLIFGSQVVAACPPGCSPLALPVDLRMRPNHPERNGISCLSLTLPPLATSLLLQCACPRQQAPAASPFRSLAEKVLEFQSKTPPRFRVPPKGATTRPALAGASRGRAGPQQPQITEAKVGHVATYAGWRLEAMPTQCVSVCQPVCMCACACACCIRRTSHVCAVPLNRPRFDLVTL